MPLNLTPEQDAAIRAHAARDYPHECCGFLVGHVPLPAGEVGEVCGASPSPAPSPPPTRAQDSPRNRFEIDPGELVKVDRAARAEGLGVVGFYHSPPGRARAAVEL